MSDQQALLTRSGYACNFATRTKSDVASPAYNRYDRWALTGPYAAFARTVCNPKGVPYDCGSGANAVDTRSGKVVGFADPAFLHADYWQEACLFKRIVVSPTGAMVVSVACTNGTGGTQYEIQQAGKQQPAGGPVLDSGTDVDPDSLAIAGRRIYWVRGGEIKTALL